MRLAILATPAALSDLRPALGALDGDVIRARLTLPDASFRVKDLDPAVDLAEQLDVLYESGGVDPTMPVLFYASSPVVLSVEGELFLCLDPANPGTGDSLRDLAQLFRERARGPVAMVLECWHAPDEADPFRSATVAAAAKAAVDPATSGVELMIAAHPADPDEDEDRASPLTCALVEALDDPEAQYGLTLADFFELARESPQIVGAVPCLAHARGRTAFELMPIVVRPPSAPPDAPKEPPRSLRPPPNVEPYAVIQDTGAKRQGPPPPPPARAAMITVDELEFAEAADVVEEAPARTPPPPPVPAMAGKIKPRTVPPPADSSPGVPLLEARAFFKPDLSDIPKTILGGKAAPASAPPAARSVPPPPRVATPAPAKAPATSAEHMAQGEALAKSGDTEGALAAFKRALALLGGSQSTERADVYLHIGLVKKQQDKRREAISSLEKALSLTPAHRGALDALLELDVAEGDFRAMGAVEEKILALVTEPRERFTRLVESAGRWLDLAKDPARARATLERARELEPNDLAVLERLQALYEADKAIPEAVAIRKRVAELTREPRGRAERYFALGKYVLHELKKEAEGLALLDLALESDPTMLEPLTEVAHVLSERQEWSVLEQIFRRMLARVERITKGEIRTEVTWELCRQLGILFLEHLEDPALALDAFEDAVTEKPLDLETRLTTADLARQLGKNDRVAHHLQAAAFLSPDRVETFHELFDAFQKIRRPDQAFQAAAVTMHLECAESRERFIFEEHKTDGVPKPAYALRPESWDWLRVSERDVQVEAILAAITPAAIGARLAALAAEGRLPGLDPATRQDPEKSTISIVRSFTWASHFLGVPAPAIHLHDDPSIGLAAVIAEEPTVIAGGKVLRGRSLPDLAFVVGQHLAYHVGCHRLMLYYPSIEELSQCFLAAVRLVLPEVPIPGSARAQVVELERGINVRLTEGQRVDLAAAVAAFEKQGSRADIGAWVAAAEKCATRAGFLLSGDLEVAITALRLEPGGVLDEDAKIADLMGFAVSDELHALRETLGIAIQP